MRTPERAISAAAIVVLLAAALSACSQPAAPRTSSPPKTEPASTPATDTSGAESTAAPGATQGGDVWATVEAKCTVCHTLDRVENARKDWKGWSSAVDHMVDNGAKLTPEERTAVVDYLASRTQ